MRVDGVNTQRLVFDIGTGYSKIGFANDTQPHVFPTIIGRPRNKIGSLKDIYVGDEAKKKRGILVNKSPIENGFVTNFDDWEKIISHAYEILNVPSEEHSVLLTKISLFANHQIENYTKIMFESFNVPSMNIVPQSYLSLIASGRTTGVNLNIGDGVCEITPYIEGCAHRYNIEKLDIAGNAITKKLGQSINEEYMMKVFNFTNSKDKDILRDIKEKLCYVSIDYNAEMESFTPPKTYELPDGQKITVGNGCLSPEILFQPSLFPEGNQSLGGIHECTYNSIMKCDHKIRNNLFENIVLSGGITITPGFVEKMQKEMDLLSITKTNIIALPQRQNMAWIGGTIYATSYEVPKSMWISKGEYDEIGPTIIHKKYRYIK